LWFLEKKSADLVVASSDTRIVVIIKRETQSKASSSLLWALRRPSMIGNNAQYHAFRLGMAVLGFELRLPYYTPLQVPRTGPPWREMPITRAFFYISFKVPSKGAPLQVPSQSPHRERRFISRAFFTCLSKSLVKESLLQVPPNGPLWRETPVPEPSFTYLSEP
jgi:hypothetical protein